MLNVRASICIIAGLSVLVSACGGGAAGKKVAIRKGDRGGASSWIKDSDIREEQVTATETVQGKGGTQTVKNRKSFCLSLPKLVEKLQARNAKDDVAKREMIALYTFDLDFVELDSDNRSIVRALVSTDTKQKRKYFFGLQPGLMQVETVPAQSLATGDTLAKNLFAVDKQVECKMVTFSNGRVYEILPGYTPRRIVLKGRTEYRIYERDGRDMFRVAIVDAKPTPVCTTGDRAQQLVKEEYMVARSRDLNRIAIGRNLGALLHESVKDKVPELEQQLNGGNKLRAGASRIFLSAHTYEVFSGLVRAGKADNVTDCAPKAQN